MQARSPEFNDVQAFLLELGLEVQDAQSTPEVFGNWHICAAYGDVRVRVIWDGQDGLLVIQKPKAHGCGDGWRDGWLAGAGLSSSEMEWQVGIRSVLEAQAHGG